ncbi:hypothetical protein ACFC1R_04380 [Kitasatospora sp. NPDC056138]|uniref:hypothetical protein n=1 Tax=Kitasatospora sp. NPDC056138 TaxID=3345724 RepID=UPI0035DB181B
MPSNDLAHPADHVHADHTDAGDTENFRTLLSRLVSSLEADRKALAGGGTPAPAGR